MLELRPNCEYCDRDLPPGTRDARICTYECTFCARCAEAVLRNVCPNCGGGFTPRPLRPAAEWRPGVGLSRQPASTKRRHLTWDRAMLDEFVQRVAGIDPGDR